MKRAPEFARIMRLLILAHDLLSYNGGATTFHALSTGIYNTITETQTTNCIKLGKCDSILDESSARVLNSRHYRF